MEKPDTASIIIPTYRRQQSLRNLLASLQRQTSLGDFEIVIANDAEDEDLSHLKNCFTDLPLTIVNVTGKHGRPIARNRGAQAARGEVLIFLDDDMTVCEKFVEAHLSKHIHEKVAVAGNILSPPEFVSHPLAMYLERQGARRHLKSKVLPPRVFRTGNASVSRKLFLEIGMFDESITTYGEDLDIAMKLAYAGAKFVFAEEAKSIHHYTPDIDDMLAKLDEWGRYTLPVHRGRHPGLAKHLWLDIAVPEGKLSVGDSLKHHLLWFALNPLFFRIARTIYGVSFLGRLLFPVIDYMRVYTYLRAYRSAIKDKGTRGSSIT